MKKPPETLRAEQVQAMMRELKQPSGRQTENGWLLSCSKVLIPNGLIRFVNGLCVGVCV